MISDELKQFSEVINDCRILSSSVKVTKQISIKYVFAELYNKLLLILCEIRTLLIAGYPEGALLLARTTYEIAVIMTYLNDRKKDKDLIERYCDDFSVKTCWDDLKLLEYIIANDPEDEEVQRKLDEERKKYEELQKKYTAYLNRTYSFDPYWWAGKGKSFNQIRKDANFPENYLHYLYNISCYRAHAGMASMLKLDNTEEGLLIGTCEGGKEDPMLFALYNLKKSTELYFNLRKKDFSIIALKIAQLLDRLMVPEM